MSSPSAEKPVVTTRRPRGRPRDEGADARILESAATLMLDRGATDVTIDEVAARAGVGKATVYRRYPSKDAMAAAALSTLFTREIPVPDTGSFHDDMVAVYEATIAFASSARGQAFLRLAAGASCRSDRIAELYRTAYERRRDTFAVVVDRAVERGEVSGELLDRTLFLDALPALLLFRTVTRSPLPTREDVPALLRQALDGALPR